MSRGEHSLLLASRRRVGDEVCYTIFMKTLQECIKEAGEKGVAIGHFNVSDSEGFRAVVDSAKELGVPVIIGVSEKERSFLGVAEIRALVTVEKDKGQLVFLNADHTYSVEASMEAVDNHFDSVIIDGAEKPFFENIMMTKEVVKYTKEKYPDMIVEGELGFIGTGSMLRDEIPDGVSEETQTTVEDAKTFVHETCVDLFAPSVGNVHGLVKGGEPKLNIARIKAIAEAVSVPLVLHGASGNTDEDVSAAIDAGIRIVHINTELRQAYKKGIEKGMSSDELAPYKFMAEGVEEMKKIVTQKLKVFNKLS
ncbi:MAG: Fructose-bisphosphate aldolase, class [Parcubacteria group bacterium]|nr:Fructose-bisphosphate aldolase, class [Parcubacteria group bacterium]